MGVSKNNQKNGGHYTYQGDTSLYPSILAGRMK